MTQEFGDDGSAESRHAEAFDQRTLDAWSAKHPDLIERLIRIGLLSGASAEGLDPQKTARTLAHYLPGISRLLETHALSASRAGDDGEARRTLAAMNGMARFAQSNESGSFHLLLEATDAGSVATHWVIDNLLKRDDLTASDLLAWRQAVAPAEPDAATAAAILRGESNMKAPDFLFSLTNGAEHSLGDNPAASAEAWANLWEARVQQTEKLSLKEIEAGPPLPAYEVPTGLPDAARAYLESRVLEDGTLKDWIGEYQHWAMIDAALAIAAGEAAPNEPVTGKPFQIDSNGQFLKLPDPPYTGSASVPIPRSKAH